MCAVRFAVSVSLHSTLLDGPWDMAVVVDKTTQVTAFVSNVLSGTVARIDLSLGANGATLLSSSRIIASGYALRPRYGE